MGAFRTAIRSIPLSLLRWWVSFMLQLGAAPQAHIGVQVAVAGPSCLIIIIFKGVELLEVDHAISKEIVAAAPLS